MLQRKRIYEPAAKSDGIRILVDRLWPRGIRKEVAHIDLWLKEIAPSTELRQWFNHEPGKWEEFKRRYHIELLDQSEHVEELREKAATTTVTLLYAAHDEQFNHARALEEFLSA